MAELADELRGDDVLPLQRKAVAGAARGAALPHRRRAAYVLGDPRDVDGAEQKVHPLDRSAVLGAEADRLPEVLQHCVRAIAVADRGVERADALGRNDADAAARARLIPEVEVRDAVVGAADDFLILVAEAEDRAGFGSRSVSTNGR